MEHPHIPTMIEVVDRACDGGPLQGQIVLVAGHPGTAKTTFCCHVAFHNAKAGRKVVYISVEQYEANLKLQLSRTGFRLEDVAENLRLVDLTSVRNSRKQQSNWFETVRDMIIKVKEEHGTEIVIVDSLTAISEIDALESPRNALFEFVDGLRKTGLTAYLISEMIADPPLYGPFGSEGFLVDGILHLTMEIGEKILDRFLQITKMRGIDQDAALIKFEILPGEIVAYSQR